MSGLADPLSCGLRPSGAALGRMTNGLALRGEEKEGGAALKSVQPGLPPVGNVPLSTRTRVFFDQRRPEVLGPAGLARNALEFDPDLLAARLCPQTGADQLPDRLSGAFAQTVRLWRGSAWRRWRSALSVVWRRRA